MYVEAVVKLHFELYRLVCHAVQAERHAKISIRKCRIVLVGLLCADVGVFGSLLVDL